MASSLEFDDSSKTGNQTSRQSGSVKNLVANCDRDKEGIIQFQSSQVSTIREERSILPFLRFWDHWKDNFKHNNLRC